MSGATLFPDANGSRVAGFIRDAVAWWLRELTSIMPGNSAYWLTDAGLREVLLIPEETIIRLQLQDERGRILGQGSATANESMPAAIHSLLDHHRLDRLNTPIGIRLPASMFFVRELPLPREVGRSVEQVALTDLLRKTPFRQDDIYHAFTAHGSRERILVTQTVIRRKFVDDAATALGIDPVGVTFIEMKSSKDGGANTQRIRLKANAVRRSWLAKTFIGLLAAVFALCMVAVALQYAQQQAVLDELDRRIAAVGVKAKDVRSQVDASNLSYSVANQLRSRKRDGVRLLQLWDELSRILPGDSWVSELRMSQGDKGALKVTMAGFSPAAANLVGIVDQSLLFDSVSLTAPIAIDPTEQRERFVLQASINPQSAQKAER